MDVDKISKLVKEKGVARVVFLERPLPPQKLPTFPLKSDVGFGFVWKKGAVRSTEDGDNIVHVPLQRVRAEGAIEEEVADDIRQQEDRLALGLLYGAGKAGAIRTNLPHMSLLADPRYEDNTFWLREAMKVITRRRLKMANIIMHPIDYQVIFGKEVREGTLGKVDTWKDVDIYLSDYHPGVAFFLPEAKYVGFLPISWGLEATPLTGAGKPEGNHVVDEELGFLVANYKSVIVLGG